MRPAFDPAPVIADVLHLLAHPDELRAEPLSGCGTCACSGVITLPEGRGRAACGACQGAGVR